MKNEAENIPIFSFRPEKVGLDVHFIWLNKMLKLIWLIKKKEFSLALL